MTALIVIPARLNSIRLPGKMLLEIRGRPLIEWTWRAALRSGYPTLIATDSTEIRDVARRFGARAVRTGAAENGTERCAQAVHGLESVPDIVVNWQGDSPLCPSRVPAMLVNALRDPGHEVATPVLFCDQLRPGEVTVAANQFGRALYFSRSPVPSVGPWLSHVGVYAYRARALRLYGSTPTPLETTERLEQLRFIERGVPVLCVPLVSQRFPEVNEPADLEEVAALLEG